MQLQCSRDNTSHFRDNSQDANGFAKKTQRTIAGV